MTLERGAVPLADGGTWFSVWAPNASQVEVAVGCDGAVRIFPLSRAPDGIHSGTVLDASPGSDYTYRLDGGADRPDPVSRWRPFGVHGPTRVVDTAAASPDDIADPGREAAIGGVSTLTVRSRSVVLLISKPA